MLHVTELVRLLPAAAADALDRGRNVNVHRRQRVLMVPD